MELGLCVVVTTPLINVWLLCMIAISQPWPLYIHSLFANYVMHILQLLLKTGALHSLHFMSPVNPMTTICYLSPMQPSNRQYIKVAMVMYRRILKCIDDTDHTQRCFVNYWAASHIGRSAESCFAVTASSTELFIAYNVEPGCKLTCSHFTACSKCCFNSLSWWLPMNIVWVNGLSNCSMESALSCPKNWMQRYRRTYLLQLLFLK